MCAPRLLWSEGQSLSQYGPCYDQSCAHSHPSGPTTLTPPPRVLSVELSSWPALLCVLSAGPVFRTALPAMLPFPNLLVIDQLKNIENLTL